MSRTASTSSRICWVPGPPVSLTHRRWGVSEMVEQDDECGPDHQTTTMRVLLVPCGEPSLPQKNDALDKTWRYFPFNVAAVIAAIDSMCETINLPHQDCTTWRRCHHDASESRVYITMHAHGQDTVVGVHFQPTINHSACNPNVVFVTLVGIGALVALLAMVGHDAGAAFDVMMFESVYWLACVMFILVVPRWRRQRALSAWSRAWRRTFWVTLEARLASSRIYR